MALAQLPLSARLEALYKARAFQLALALAESEGVSHGLVTHCTYSTHGVPTGEQGWKRRPGCLVGECGGATAGV